MAIFYSDGFEVYTSKLIPKPELSIDYSENLCRIADSLKLSFSVQHGYMIFETKEDYSIIQFYI